MKNYLSNQIFPPKMLADPVALCDSSFLLLLSNQQMNKEMKNSQAPADCYAVATFMLWLIENMCMLCRYEMYADM